MRILHDNIVKTATISSLRADPAYPAINLATPYLTQRYQATEATDIITMSWDSPQTATDMFWAFNNVAFMMITFYDENWVTTDRIGFNGESIFYHYGYGNDNYYGYSFEELYGYYIKLSTKRLDTLMWCWATKNPFSNVTIEVTAREGYGNVFMGAFALGDAKILTWPDSDWTESWDDRSRLSETQAGQVRQSYVEPLRVYDWKFSALTREQSTEMKDWYAKIGIGAHMWVAPFEHNLEFVPPIYATLQAPLEIKKKGDNFSYRLKIKEAR